MKDMNFLEMQKKFINPDVTANGDQRASVPLMKATTLWFNTGTLCNIECVNCYIESSPKNDSLVYITPDEVSDYLDQIDQREWATNEIAFTGGEPFLNPDMIEITRRCGSSRLSECGKVNFTFFDLRCKTRNWRLPIYDPSAKLGSGKLSR